MSRGRVIRARREDLGLTQEQLAELAGVKRPWLSLIELDRSRRPDRDMLERLALALRLPRSFLHAPAPVALVQPALPEFPAELLQPDAAALIGHRVRLGGRDRAEPVWVPLVENPATDPGGSRGEQVWLPLFPGWMERDDDWIAVPVRGSQLAPRLMDGHRAFVNRGATPKPGDVVLVRHDAEARFWVYQNVDRLERAVRLETLDGAPPLPLDDAGRIMGVVREVHYWL